MGYKYTYNHHKADHEYQHMSIIQNILLHSYYMYINGYNNNNIDALTEGMAKVSDVTDVTALACNKSDTKPAIMLPMYVHNYGVLYP